MKKLESIKGTKFELLKSQMNQINGSGVSYESSTTHFSGGETKTDLTAYDVCVPYEEN